MEQIEYIIGDAARLERMPEVRAWRPFDPRVVEFCGRLSKKLLAAEGRALDPDLAALVFWLRKSNIQRIAQLYKDLDAHLGRGLVFHITPGNVPLSFAYSLAMGLLTGNTNVLRLPSRRFPQADLFCETLQSALREDPELAQRVCLIRYPHDQAITDALSARCRMRIIWGGNDTINLIRRSPIPPRATELTFANRFSVCLIDADKYLSDYDPQKTAHGFFIDTYLTDQNACSSPRIVIWLGNRVAEAKDRFWTALCGEIREYEIAPVTTVNKLLTFCKFASGNPCRLAAGPDFRLVRVEAASLSRNILENIGNSGYFYECEISDVGGLLPICAWELQTVSCIGFDCDELREFILSQAPDGVDRIVPVGHTMDFGVIWDGRDVVREMTRNVAII